ncbi:MAG: hypothetical protein J0I06_15445 [Planctomycetes bacterium]|nr:hypothetical protein [Planctomycetota bacterium]
MSTAVVTPPTITVQRAITIAETDARPTYSAEWLGKLMARAALHDGWHLVYSPKREGYRTGSGPHYVIDASTGAIVSKTYYQ